jgi:mono/diheme cytochrome c family protein
MKLHFKLMALIFAFPALGCSGGDEITDSNGTGGSAMGGAAVAGTTASGATAGSSAGTPGSGGSAAGSNAQGGAAGGQVSTAGSGGTSSPSGGASGAGGSAATAGAGGATMLDGAALYLANCAACHGQQGAGGPLGPELQHPVRDYSAWVVRHGRAMTTFPAPMLAVATDKLPDASLTLIWDYLDQAPQPTTGQALYLDYCGNCHGADGKGGPTARNILNELDNLKSQVRQGSHLGQFDMRREYMPALPATRLSNAELDLIYAYVASL